MNITDEVREEILLREDDYESERREYLCALVKCLGSISIEGGKSYLVLESKNRLPIITAAALIKELTDAEIEYGSGEGKGYYVKAEGAEAAKIFACVSEGRAVTDLGDTEGITSRTCAAAYARGAFLAGGSVYIPSESVTEKSVGYHIEFIFFGEDAATAFADLLKRCELTAHISKKGNYFSVYAKSADAVSDILAFMGATESVIKTTSVNVTRLANGNVNRKTNCEMANMDKSQGNIMRQVGAIENLKASGEYDKLDEKLKETCEMRLKYREKTLGELAKIMGISKSGLNHRLVKITELGSETNGGRNKERRKGNK